MTELLIRNKSRYGWVPDLPDHRDRVFTRLCEQFGHLPPTVDLRPGMPLVYNQGRIGSCTANAICGAFEFDLRKQNIHDFMPSRLFVYFNERSIEGSTPYDAGAQIRDGVKTIATLGICSEAEWPYDDTPADSDGVFPSDARAGQRPDERCYSDARYNEAVVYERVAQSLAHIKSTLANGFPVVFGFTVFSSFETPEVASSGIVPMPQSCDQALGGHAVVLTGYNDTKQRFLVRNSWGDIWGMTGYFTLPYSYVTNPQLASDFWVVRRVS
ncbi:MAG: C1 family peptidase [Candidatus Dormibacteria bacterium]